MEPTHHKKSLGLQNLPFSKFQNLTQKSATKQQKCTFVLIPAPSNGNCYSGLDQVICRNGGQLLLEEGSHENAVTFLDENYYYDHPKEDCVLPPDTFSSKYIYDVERAHKAFLPPPDLNRYRLTDSKFHPSCDVNKVLFFEMKWSEFPVDSKYSSKFGKVTAQTASAARKKYYDTWKLYEEANLTFFPFETTETTSVTKKNKISTNQEEIQQDDNDCRNGISTESVIYTECPDLQPGANPPVFTNEYVAPDLALDPNNQISAIDKTQHTSLGDILNLRKRKHSSSSNSSNSSYHTADSNNFDTTDFCVEGKPYHARI